MIIIAHWMTLWVEDYFGSGVDGARIIAQWHRLGHWTSESDGSFG